MVESRRMNEPQPVAKPHGRRYPWDEWLTQKGEVVLTRGVDFICEPYGMTMQISQQLRKRGIYKTVRIYGDRVVIAPPDPRYEYLRKRRKKCPK